MSEGPAKSFDELNLGDTARFTATLSELDHEAFAKSSGDRSPVHTDAAFAQAQGFAGKIGYAFHLSSLLSRLYGMYLPGGSSVCLKQESNFPNPWYPGDTVAVEAEITRKFESTKLVEIKTEMKREDGTTIFRGTGLVKLNR